MLDPALVGNWYSSARSITFVSSGFLEEFQAFQYAVDPVAKSLSVGTDLWGLTFGDGTDIYGVWTKRSTASGVVFSGSITFHNYGKYTNNLYADGELAELISGQFTIEGRRVEFNKLVGRVFTEPAGNIVVSGAYTKDQTGTYFIEPDGQLKLTLDGIQETFSRHYMTIDPRLVGTWSLGLSTYEIDGDGWYLLKDGPRGYTISGDGLTLTLDEPGPVMPFDRVFGVNQELVGVWSRTIMDGGDTVVEELTFREEVIIGEDPSFSDYWTKNGSFMAMGSGRYSAGGGQLARWQRVALLSTAAPDFILFHKSPDPDDSGTYTVSADQNSWTYTTGGVDFVYTRVLP